MHFYASLFCSIYSLTCFDDRRDSIAPSEAIDKGAVILPIDSTYPKETADLLLVQNAPINASPAALGSATSTSSIAFL